MNSSALYDGLIFIGSLMTVILFSRGKIHKVIGTALLVVTTSYIAIKFGLPRATLHLLITAFLVLILSRIVDNYCK